MPKNAVSHAKGSEKTGGRIMQALKEGKLKNKWYCGEKKLKENRNWEEWKNEIRWRKEDLGKVKEEMNEKVEKETKSGRKIRKGVRKKDHNFQLSHTIACPFRLTVTLKDVTE